jgi:hypothetical protein
MKPFSSAMLVLCLAAPAAAAQTGSQPSLVLTIFGGVASGNGLWDISQQPLCLPDPNCSGSPHDTLRLTRDVSSSLLVGAGATYFKGPHLGFTLEVFYLGLPLDDGCTGLFYNADPEARNQQLCDNITGASLSTSAIAFFAGVVLRASPTRSLSPYLRAGLGFLSYSSGTVDMSGVFIEGGNIKPRSVLIDPHPKGGALTGQVAAGLTARLSPGYQFRFEVRDILVPLERVTGSASDNLQPPTDTKVFHRVALTLGLDVVLERKPGRRY